MSRAGKPFLNYDELPVEEIKEAIINFVKSRKLVTRFPLLTTMVNKNFAPIDRSISQPTVRKITYEIIENGQLFLYKRFRIDAIYPIKQDKISKFKLVSGQELSDNLRKYKLSGI